MTEILKINHKNVFKTKTIDMKVMFYYIKSIALERMVNMKCIMIFIFNDM